MKADLPNEIDQASDRGIVEAYNLLVLEVKQLKHTRDVISARIEKAEAARDLLSQLVSPKTTSRPRAHVGKKAPSRRRGPHKDSKTALTLSHAKRALLGAGRPLGRTELLNAMSAAGFNIPTPDPARFLGRAMWRSSEFIHMPKEGYWLSEENHSSETTSR